MLRLLFTLIILTDAIGVFGQTDWTQYNRSEIGLQTEKSRIKVNWTPVNYNNDEPQANIIKTSKSIEVIDGVLEEQLVKTSFEPISIMPSEIILDLEFQYRENAKMDITSLSYLRAPYLVDMQAVAQLKDGRMIFGGRDMICVYDGYKMQVYKSNSTYQFDEIFSIVVDHQNRAWIASNGGICYFENGNFYKTNNLETGKVWNYWVGENDEIYVATYNQGIYILKNELTEHIYKEGKIDEVLDFYQTSDGKFWYGLDNGLAFKEKGNWYEYPFGTIQGSIRSLLEFDNKLFIGTFQDGLYFLQNNEIFHLETRSLNKTSIYNLQQVNDQIWIPMFGKGILMLSKDSNYSEIRDIDGLLSNDIIKVYHDTYGNVWCTDLFNGISKIQDIKIRPLSPPQEELVCRRQLSFHDTIWYFGADKSVYRKINGQLYQLNYKGDGLLRSGDALCGSMAVFSNYDQGKPIFKDDQIFTFDAHEHDYQGTCLDPVFGSKGEIFYTNHPEEVRFFYHDSIFNLSALGDFNGMHLKEIVANQNREICIRFENSIAFIDPDHYLIINNSNGLISNWILDVIPWKKGFCVITDKGVQLFENGALTHSFPINILSEGKTCIAKQINENKILVKAETELFILAINDNNIIIENINYNKGSYLVGLLFTDMPEENLVFRKGDRNYSFDPADKISGSAKSILKIDSVYLNLKKIAHHKITLSQDDKLYFWISVVSLKGKGLLKYKLISEKNQIIEGITSDREIAFSNLLKGKYKLELYHEFNGQISDVTSIEINVLPYWFQTWFFYVMLALIILSGVLIYVRIRLKRSEKRQIELERIVDEKTIELQKEKVLVESELHEKEILLKEVNHRVKNNMQLASSLLHLQAGKSKSEIEKAALKLASERIKSLSLAHQELYLGNDYSSLKLADYINRLVDNLTGNTEIHCSVQIDQDLTMDIEKAQSLGLVINELLTNSIKHAWSKQEHNKKMSITLFQHEKRVELVYEDNGKGLPRDLDLTKTKSLGFTLINSIITRRLKGKLLVANADHFSIKITFEL